MHLAAWQRARRHEPAHDLSGLACSDTPLERRQEGLEQVLQWHHGVRSEAVCLHAARAGREDAALWVCDAGQLEAVPEVGATASDSYLYATKCLQVAATARSPLRPSGTEAFWFWNAPTKAAA